MDVTTDKNASAPTLNQLYSLHNLLMDEYHSNANKMSLDDASTLTQAIVDTALCINTVIQSLSSPITYKYDKNLKQWVKQFSDENTYQ